MSSGRGARLLEDAIKKENKKPMFGQPKLDEAAELYGSAGNAFKLEKMSIQF